MKVVLVLICFAQIGILGAEQLTPSKEIRPGVSLSVRADEKLVQCVRANGVDVIEAISETSRLEIRLTKEAKIAFGNASLSGVYAGKSWFECVELVALDISTGYLQPKRTVELKKKREGKRIVVLVTIVGIPRDPNVQKFYRTNDAALRN